MIKLLYNFNNGAINLFFFHKVNSAQKSIRVYQKSSDSFIVSSPKLPDAIVKDFLISNLDSIVEIYKTSKTKYIYDDIIIGDKALFHGEMRDVRYSTGAYSFHYDNGEFKYSAPFYDTTAIKSLLIDFYKSTMKLVIPSLVEQYSGAMGVHPSKVNFRSAKSRWGSCSSSGAVSFNIMSAILPQRCLEYLVIHEIAHLVHLNHSSSFKSLISSFCPDYRKVETEIKRYGNLLRL